MTQKFAVRVGRAAYIDRKEATWKDSYLVTNLSSDQVKAAELVGRLDGDFERVDQLLCLQPGATAGWFSDDKNFTRCASRVDRGGLAESS